jgi:ABC-type multidrug transport system fused ATPase/permease subunit
MYPDEQDKSDFDWQTTKRLMGYLTPYKRKIYVALAASLLSAMSSVLGPPIVSWAIDKGVEKRDLTIVGMGVFAYLLVQGLGALGFGFKSTGWLSPGRGKSRRSETICSNTSSRFRSLSSRNTRAGG